VDTGVQQVVMSGGEPAATGPVAALASPAGAGLALRAASALETSTAAFVQSSPSHAWRYLAVSVEQVGLFGDDELPVRLKAEATVGTLLAERLGHLVTNEFRCAGGFGFAAARCVAAVVAQRADLNDRQGSYLGAVGSGMPDDTRDS
jgi:hypothetical protein